MSEDDDLVIEKGIENTVYHSQSSSTKVVSPCHQALTQAILRQNSEGCSSVEVTVYTSSRQEVSDVIEVKKPSNPNYTLQEMLLNSSVKKVLILSHYVKVILTQL